MSSDAQADHDHDGRADVAAELRDRSTHARVVELEGHHRGEEMTTGQKVWYGVLWWVSTTIARTYFRTKVWGRENVPTAGAFIISPIHRSNLDTPLIPLIMRRRMRYMGKESLWKNRFWAWFFSMGGGFPVARATADREALKACQEVLERGEPLVMFPEGTRQSGPFVSEMFDGPAYLACKEQVPILPIGLGGTEAAMPKGRKFPPPKKLTIVVGTPIFPPQPTDRGRVSRKAVKALTEQLRDTIQELFDEAQVKAGTPNLR
ncbi:MAG: 1-acyl-sn-glycerol-3-phosphate acyltransferase [Actinobacteria bacterium]|nr:1-acyl-sn-glycerol-3-phosphate acyltransferase [Actinomycetota bacterium]